MVDHIPLLLLSVEGKRLWVIEVALLLKGDVAVSTRRLDGGGVCTSTGIGRLLSGVASPAALVDGAGDVCVLTDNAFLGGIDTACGRNVDISSSLLLQSSGVCWILFFFLFIGRPPLHCWGNCAVQMRVKS